MSLTTILIIVGAAVLFIAFLFFTVSTIKRKRENKKLDSNLKKIQQENKDFGNSEPEVEIYNDEEVREADDEDKNEAAAEESKDVPVVEDYVESDEHRRNIITQASPVVEDDIDLDFEREFNNLRKRKLDDDFYDKRILREKKTTSRKDDFENFLDENSYTRIAWVVTWDEKGIIK